MMISKQTKLRFLKKHTGSITSETNRNFSTAYERREIKFPNNPSSRFVITLNNEKEHNSRTLHDKFGNTKFTEKILDFDDDRDIYFDNMDNLKVGTMELKSPNNNDSAPQT